MNAAKATILGILILLSLGPLNTASAADISLTADTEIELTGLTTTLYALSGSEADTLTVDGSTLTVDIPADSTFTLGAGSPMHNVLRITPTGGSVTLTLISSNLSAGYAGEWTLTSAAATSWDILFSVSDTTTTHQVDVNQALYNRFNANAQGEIQFTYTGDFTDTTFSVATWKRVSSGGDSSSQEDEQETTTEEPSTEDVSSDEDIEALKERVRELQLRVIQLAQQLIELLEARINVLRLVA